MSDQDLHTRLSVDCFNSVWKLIETSSRSEKESLLMREMAHASLYHWLKREDHTPTHISVGLWQVSRVHSLLGESDTALQYAAECIKVSEGLDVFYLAYGYEAAARACMGLGQTKTHLEHYLNAKNLLSRIEDEDNVAHLLADLEEIAPHS